MIGEKPLTYEESIRILITGVSGFRENYIHSKTGVSRYLIRRFMRGFDIDRDSVDKIAFFVWNKMNVTILLSEEDYKV